MNKYWFISILLLILTNCNNQQMPSYTVTIDIFGATPTTTIQTIGHKKINYQQEAHAAFTRYTLSAKDAKLSLQVVDAAIPSIGAFTTEKSFVVTPTHRHVYLQAGIPATYYIQGNSQTGQVKLIAVKATGSGINFFISSQQENIEVPFGNATPDTLISQQLTPDHLLSVALPPIYEIHMPVDESLWGDFSFSVRHDMGEHFDNDGQSHTWATAFNTDATISGQAAKTQTKLAHYSMPKQPSMPPLGNGRYLYSVTVFNYNEEAPPTLYASSDATKPLAAQTTINRKHGYYQLQWRSDDPQLSIVLKQGSKPSKAGAFSDGSFTLTPTYANVYLIDNHPNSERSSSINTVSPAITYYLSLQNNGTLMLTALKKNAQDDLLFFYDSAESQASFSSKSMQPIEPLANHLTLLPPHQSHQGYYITQATSAVSYKANDVFTFKARTTVGNQLETAFGMHPSDSTTVAIKQAHFVLPADFMPSDPILIEPFSIMNINMSPGPNHQSMGFSWASSAPNPGRLRIWQNNLPAIEYPATEHWRMQKLAGFYSNQVFVDNLQPGATYFYQIIHNNETQSAVYTLQTPPNTPNFHFIALADAQLGKNGLVEPVARAWHQTLNHVQTTWPNAAFILSSGDQIEHPDQQYQYNLFFAHPIFTTMPLTTTVGSHDKHAIYLEQFPIPPNLTAIGNSPTGGNYWFAYKEVLFISLDTNNRLEADAHQHAQYLRQAVKEYQLKHNGNKPRWQIVNLHYTLYSGTHYANDAVLTQLRTILAPTIAELDIDVVFSGHDHAHSRTLMLKAITLDSKHLVEPITSNYVSTPNNAYAAYTKKPGEFVYLTNNTASLGFNQLSNINDRFFAHTQQANRPSVSLVEVSPQSLSIKSYYTDQPIQGDNSFDSFILYHED